MRYELYKVPLYITHESLTELRGLVTIVGHNLKEYYSDFVHPVEGYR